jgi:Zn-dependent peptidase ImmA (M78 family)
MPVENPPRILFRRRGNAKITDEIFEQANIQAQLLEKATTYADINIIDPQILSKPSLNWDYINRAVKVYRKLLNMNELIIDLKDLARAFSRFNAILIPVLWGKKERHENAIHIHLPSFKITWIYINLDTNILDFKFWLIHEFGHIISPLLSDKEAEDFADDFAGMFLFPEEECMESHEKCMQLPVSSQVNLIKEKAKEMQISPAIIWNCIKNYGDFHKQKISAYNIYPATQNFIKRWPTMSQELFKDKPVKASQYIKVCKTVFQTPVFDILSRYIKAEKKEASFIQTVFGCNVFDAKSIYEELSR